MRIELKISYYTIRDFITIAKYSLMDAERMIPYDKLQKVRPHYFNLSDISKFVITYEQIKKRKSEKEEGQKAV